MHESSIVCKKPGIKITFEILSINYRKNNPTNLKKESYKIYQCPLAINEADFENETPGEKIHLEKQIQLFFVIK